MSKAPEGFPLPDELVNSLEKYARDNESDLAAKEVEKFKKSIVENNIPKNESDTNIKTGEKITEPKKKLRTGAEVVLDRIKQEEEISDIRNKRSEREDVSKRVGGSAFKQKALDAIRKAEKADQNKPIFERPEKTTKNKKFDPESKSTRRYKRLKEEENLLIHRDNLKGVSVSSLPDEGEIENTNFPKKTFSKKEKKYKDISKEEPNIEFYEDEYDPNGLIDSELPDSSNIIGKDLEFETGKKLKSSKEKTIKNTQDIADEYNFGKLKREDIKNVKSLDELISIINKSEGIQGSNDYFDKETLIEIIEMVRRGELTIEYVTRSAGLRQKVFDLMNNKIENPSMNIVEPETIIEEKESQGIASEILDESEVWVMPDKKNIPTPEPLPEVPLPTKELSKSKISIGDEYFEKTRIGDQILMIDPDVLSALNLKKAELEKSSSEIKSKIEEYSKPVKKFLLKAFSIGQKEFNKLVEENQKAQEEYKKTFDEVVDSEVDKELERLEKLHANNREKRAYQVIRKEEVPKDIFKKYPVVEDYFRSAVSLGEDVTITNLLSKGNNLPVEFKKEIRDIFPEIVAQKLRNEFSRKIIQQQDSK